LPATAQRARRRAQPVAGKSLATQRKRIAELLSRLRVEYPEARTELQWSTPFELLVATILSAQSTDVTVNKVMPQLMARYPTVKDLAEAKREELEALIYPTGFFRQKSRSITAVAQALLERHGGEVPQKMEDLVKLPGVGRKTASVVLSSVWKIQEGIAVDTHVQRLAKRLGLTDQTDPAKIEAQLMKATPRDQWGFLSFALILHGRRICVAQKPRCERCVLNDICPSSLV
jgi:endonuclease-3